MSSNYVYVCRKIVISNNLIISHAYKSQELGIS